MKDFYKYTNDLTILTPTFNRGEELKRLYKSFLKQEFINFKWVIVDDGSRDNTRDIVNQFIY